MENSKKSWLSSKEAMKKAKIKDCDLMHHRIHGDLAFEKRGNAYFYSEESIEKLKSIKNNQS
ncbi:hypothetical protein [Mangrovimonas xylaniphaga]|uniref:hypothetical protein n=1 Tax=Mangrovimonas xylaniphaga TaxID=1645915 RepID=UPI0006B513BB|nr:hypothetical protein [Mangrovimonas xylaniphaga]